VGAGGALSAIAHRPVRPAATDNSCCQNAKIQDLTPLPSFVRALIVVAIALQSTTTSTQQSAAPARPIQADGLVRLLADLERAVASGRRDQFTALTGTTLRDGSAAIFDRAVGSAPVTGATIRERQRQPVGDAFEVLVDVLVSHGRNGRVASWLLTARPREGSPLRYELTGLTEPAALDGLLRLTLDTTRQFAVHNLVVQAPDLTLRMDSGAAYVAETDEGVTGVVLRGDGDIHFAPPDPAEQGQLRIFSGRPALNVGIESAFIRLNPHEFNTHISSRSLTPAAVDPRERDRAQEIFDDRAGRTYSLDLRDLSQDRWSIGPAIGSLVVEFRSSRFGWLTYARAPLESEDISLFDRARGHNIASYASAERLASRGRFYSEDGGLTYDVQRVGLDLTFAPDREWLSGRASIKLRTTAAALANLTFKLSNSLNVIAVSSPSFGRLLALRVVGQNSIIVNLPATVMRGTELIVDIEYNGRVAPQAVDREAASVQLPGQPLQDPPMLIVTPEKKLLYSTQVFWYPQGQVTDYATAALRLRVPSEYQIIASGSLVRSMVTPIENAPAAGAEARFLRTVEYSTDRPVRYLACLISRFVPNGQARVRVPAVAPQAFTDLPDSAVVDGVPGVNLEVVSTPRMTAKNRQLPARVADIIRVYADLIGEAPYPDFTVAGMEDNLPGGHSPAFFAIWLQPLPSSPFNWSGDPLALESVYAPYFIAHEVAHQWWGQAVGWKNYHEQWLSEGLAQYFSVLYAAHDRPEAVRPLLQQMRVSVDDFGSQGPIALGYRLGHVRNDARVFRAIVYNKSALVLHMLRGLIGDEAFFAGLRRYYRDWRFKKAGTDDLRAAFETATPIKLSRFFERWVLGVGTPRLRVTSTIDPSGTSAVVHVQQTGDVFDLPVTVAVQYVDGRTEEINIPVTAATVDHALTFASPVRRITVRDELTLGDFSS
jgi:hypothetical protein